MLLLKRPRACVRSCEQTKKDGEGVDRKEEGVCGGGFERGGGVGKGLKLIVRLRGFALIKY